MFVRRQSFYDYHVEKFRNRISPTIIGLIGQLTCVCRHYVSYADLLKIRYSPFQCLIMVGTEDRLVREKNSYIIRRVCLTTRSIENLDHVSFR